MTPPWKVNESDTRHVGVITCRFGSRRAHSCACERVRRSIESFRLLTRKRENSERAKGNGQTRSGVVSDWWPHCPRHLSRFRFLRAFASGLCPELDGPDWLRGGCQCASGQSDPDEGEYPIRSSSDGGGPGSRGVGGVRAQPVCAGRRGAPGAAAGGERVRNARG